MISTPTGILSVSYNSNRYTVFKRALHTIHTIHGDKPSSPGVIMIYICISCKLYGRYYLVLWQSSTLPVDVYPSCLQATAASLSPHNVVCPDSLHTLPHSPLKQYWTYPTILVSAGSWISSKSPLVQLLTPNQLIKQTIYIHQGVTVSIYLDLVQ